MRCSVVFGVTLRLLVINISLSLLLSTPPLTISNVSQLTRWWPWSTGDHVYNTWPVAVLTQAVKPDIGSES